MSLAASRNLLRKLTDSTRIRLLQERITNSSHATIRPRPSRKRVTPKPNHPITTRSRIRNSRATSTTHSEGRSIEVCGFMACWVYRRMLKVRRSRGGLRPVCRSYRRCLNRLLRLWVRDGLCGGPLLAPCKAFGRSYYTSGCRLCPAVGQARRIRSQPG